MKKLATSDRVTVKCTKNKTMMQKASDYVCFYDKCNEAETHCSIKYHKFITTAYSTPISVLPELTSLAKMCTGTRFILHEKSLIMLAQHLSIPEDYMLVWLFSRTGCGQFYCAKNTLKIKIIPNMKTKKKKLKQKGKIKMEREENTVILIATTIMMKSTMK